MRAKCPYCQDGCEKCDGGYVPVGFAKGNWFTRRCQTCGFENGVRITPLDAPATQPGACVMCGGMVEWKKILKAEEAAALEKLRVK